jgi:hypothetical protein
MNLRHLLAEDSRCSARDLSAATSQHGEQEMERHLGVVHMIAPPNVQTPMRDVQFLGGSIEELNRAGYDYHMVDIQSNRTAVE